MRRIYWRQKKEKKRIKGKTQCANPGRERTRRGGELARNQGTSKRVRPRGGLHLFGMGEDDRPMKKGKNVKKGNFQASCVGRGIVLWRRHGTWKGKKSKARSASAIGKREESGSMMEGGKETPKEKNRTEGGLSSMTHGEKDGTQKKGKGAIAACSRGLLLIGNWEIYIRETPTGGG